MSPFFLLFFPTYDRALRETFPTDFFRGTTIALMIALHVLSSVLITYELKTEYPIALIASLLALNAFLFLVSWSITRGTASGLGALREKHVLNIGTPFESWLPSLAQIARQRQLDNEFLEAALDEFEVEENSNGDDKPFIFFSRLEITSGVCRNK